MSGFEDMFPLHSSQEEVENHDKEESETRIVNVSDKRHYTDTGFLILFVATLITMIVLGSYNIHNSQPEILLSGVNDQGQICGFDAAVKSKPYFYSVLTSGIGVCTSSCPAESMQLASTNPNDYYCLHDIVYAGLNTSNYISDNCFTYGQFDISKNCGCMLQLATTTSPLNRCRFSDTPIANQFTTQEFTGPFWTIASDIYKARLIVLAYGVGAPVILSLMYFWIQQSTYFEESFLFFNLSGLIGLFGCLCYFTYTTYQLDDVLLLRVTSTIIVTLLFIILIVIVTQYSNIYKASKIISRSFEFMDTMMPYIFFVPMIKFVSLTAFFVSEYCTYLYTYM